MLKICTKSFRWKPKPLAPDTSRNQPVDPSGAVSPQSPPPRPVPPISRLSGKKKGYGLEKLYDGSLTNSPEGVDVDIVAIHGLNGNAYSTWQHHNGTFWLRDLLPTDLPRARIFTYGYPAEVLFSKSVGDIEDYSRGLLIDLSVQLIGSSQGTVPRPIIFVCHSLGGLVCKQALVLANKHKQHYEDILAATAAIVFFGTPHRGAKIAETGIALGDLANALLRISKVTPLTGTIRSDLMNTLKADCHKLQALSKSFHDQLDYLGIVTFYERNLTKPLSTLVVDRESAIMGVQGEQVIPLNADHRSMCRFDSRNQEYGTVCNAIQRLAREIRLKRDSANMSLKSTEKRCMSLLYSTNLEDYKTQLPKPVDGTCSWILNDPKYRSWIESDETGLLWVTGEPGCGKTMLSVYLTEHLMVTPKAQTTSQVFYFFCDDKITTQRSAKDIVRSILHQIFQQHRKLIKYAKASWEVIGQSLVESFASLWEIFVKIVSESRLGPVGIIVDAIDECEADTRKTFLQSIRQLVHESRTSGRRPRNCVKFLITSRPSPQDLNLFDELQKRILPIDENQSRINNDINLVISNKMRKIAERAGFSEGTRLELENLLAAKAEKSFLWLNIVLQSLEECPSTSKKAFKSIINNFPRKLEAIYTNFLHRIPQENRDTARDILVFLLGSARNLSLEEINIAYTISQDNYNTANELAEDRQNSVERMLQGIIGPFIRVEGLKVSLIHQSAKDFLGGFALSSPDVTVRSYGISPSVSALGIASACIRYLLLEDFATDVFTAQGPTPESDFEDMDPHSFSGFYDIADDDLTEDDCLPVTGRYEFFDYAATNWGKHLALCENIAPEEVMTAVSRLTEAGSLFLKNWLKYFWFKAAMDYPLPEDFDTIMVAAFFNCADLLSKCLRSGVAVNQSKLDRALFWAARMGSAGSVDVLLKHGADPNSRELYQHTPLTIASNHGNMKAVEVLLADFRTDINAKGKSGRSSLSFAAANSHGEVFEALFRHPNCRVDHQDDNKWTALFWAIERDHTTIARALLGNPAVDINHVDRDGRSIVSWAAGEGFLQALQMLLDQPKIDLDLKDSNGRSPLLWAANNGQGMAIDVLLRYDVDRLVKDNDQRSALSLACKGGHTDTVKALIKYKCGFENEEDIDGWTPLAWALERQSPKTVEALLSGRAVNVNHRDKSGRTALIWAASYGYTDVVHMLLNQGADPHVADEDGQTALDLAKRYGRTEIVHLLENRLL